MQESKQDKEYTSEGCISCYVCVTSPIRSRPILPHSPRRHNGVSIQTIQKKAAAVDERQCPMRLRKTVSFA